MARFSSQHILSTSSNLLGFCLVVLTSLKITKINEATYLDEITEIVCVLLAAASLLSFLSIRSEKEIIAIKYEKLADNIFIIALSAIFIITFMIAFSIIF
ncbi:MAG: hypothetical protein PHV30_05495 [Candidatus Margulisbacteria bacterium]|nr:hypothetical protein [Candidatus Margulisiibacteriota bacterium]